MRWFRRIAIVSAALLVGACADEIDQDCDENEQFDESSGQCVVDLSAGGSDAGYGADAGGGQTRADGAEDNSESEGGGPSGPQELPDKNCSEWSDEDGDGEICSHDNCPETANPDQKDSDDDGVGDACDNCPNTANAAQRDSNDDGQGDACTGSKGYDYSKDHDGDGVPTTEDNCPQTENADQVDSDSDGRGDACDNCPEVANYNQTDSDGDGTGDACTREPAGQECDRVEETTELKQTDIYTILDKSGSMEDGGKMDQAKTALDRLADVLGGTSMQFGLFSYDTLGCEEFLSMGQHSPSEIKSSYQGIQPGGATPTGPAMEQVRTQGLFRPSGSGSANNAVVVITDGKANRCTCSGGFGCDATQYAIDEARAFNQQESTDVYVVGYQFDGDTTALSAMASAGGTGDFFEANDPDALFKTLLGVALAGCELELSDSSKGKIDPDKLWAKINGDWVDPSKLTYDSSSHTVRVDPSVCSTTGSGERDVTIVAGCPSECEESEEVCDYEDNDCDGEIDEGCEGCSAEVCDGQDNDCDGEIDEGCPPCQLRGEDCTENGDCCNDNCTEDNVCAPPCRPSGTVCSSDGQCCSGICASSSDGTSTCRDG